MVKEMLLIKRKEGLSLQEFMKHYEEVHAPLILKLCPSVRKYVRNYVVDTLRSEEGPGFDCITEVWYDDMEGFRALQEVYRSEAGKAIRDNEYRFMDRSKRLVTFLVDERISE